MKRNWNAERGRRENRGAEGVGSGEGYLPPGGGEVWGGGSAHSQKIL